MSTGDWGGVVGKGNEALPLFLLCFAHAGRCPTWFNLASLITGKNFPRVTSGFHVAKFKGYVLVFIELKLSEALYAIVRSSHLKYSPPVAFMTNCSPSFLFHLLPFIFSLLCQLIFPYLIRKYWCLQICISNPYPSFHLQACVPAAPFRSLHGYEHIQSGAHDPSPPKPGLLPLCLETESLFALFCK